MSKYETHHFNSGSDSTSVEHWSPKQQVPGSDLTSAAGAMLWVYNFFLLIEDYGYSKSRTKIGVSVDITHSKKTKSSRAENTVKKQKALEPKTQFSA